LSNFFIKINALIKLNIYILFINICYLIQGHSYIVKSGLIISKPFEATVKHLWWAQRRHWRASQNPFKQL